MEKTFETKFGKVSLRNAMLGVDKTNLEEGVEVKFDGKVIGEVIDYRDIEEMTIEEVEEFLKKNYFF